MFFLILTLLNINSYAGLHLTEHNVSDYVLKNGEYQSMEQRILAAEKMQGKLIRSFLPKVNFTYGHERYKTGPYNQTDAYGGLEAQINIFNSGRDIIENKKRNLQNSLSIIDTSILKSKLIMEIKKAMANHAFLNEVKSILQEAIKNNDANLKAAQKRISSGLATSTDSLDFKQQNLLLTQELKNIEFDLGVNQRLLLTLMAQDPQETITIDFNNAHPEHASEYQIKEITQNHFLVKQFVLHKDIAVAQNQLDKKWWLPSIDLYAAHLKMTQKEREYTPEEKRDDTSIGFKLTWPIFDGGENYRQTEASYHLAQAEIKSVKQKQLEIEKMSIDAQKKLDLAHELIHNSEENVEILTQYRQNILSEYARGIKNSPDVMQAAQRWTEAKMQFAEIKKNYTFASIDADFINGKF